MKHVVCNTTDKGCDMDQVSPGRSESNGFNHRPEHNLTSVPTLPAESQDTSQEMSSISALISRHPIEAAALALLAGAGLAILISKSGDNQKSSNATRYNDGSTADDLMSSARSAVSPILPAVERMVEAVADMGVNSGPFDRVVQMWRSLSGR